MHWAAEGMLQGSRSAHSPPANSGYHHRDLGGGEPRARGEEVTVARPGMAVAFSALGRASSLGAADDLEGPLVAVLLVDDQRRALHPSAEGMSDSRAWAGMQ